MVNSPRILLVGSDLLGNRILTSFVHDALVEIGSAPNRVVMIRRARTTAAEKLRGLRGFLFRRSLFLQTNFALRQELQEHTIRMAQFDLIVCVTFSAVLALPFSSRHIPVVCILDSGSVSHRLASPDEAPSLSFFDQLSVRIYDLILGPRVITWCFLSEWAMKVHEAVFGFRNEKVNKLSPPSRLPALSNRELLDATRRKRQSAEKLKVLFVGNYVREKGGLLLIDLISGILADRCELTIVTGQVLGLQPEGITVRNDIRVEDTKLLTGLAPKKWTRT